MNEEEFKIDELPKVLINHLGGYLDMNSLISFSSANKKLISKMKHVRNGIKFLLQLKFEKTIKENKEKLKNAFLSEQNLSSFISTTAKKDLVEIFLMDRSVSVELIKFLLNTSVILFLSKEIKINQMHCTSQWDRKLTLI